MPNGDPAVGIRPVARTVRRDNVSVAFGRWDRRSRQVAVDDGQLHHGVEALERFVVRDVFERLLRLNERQTDARRLNHVIAGKVENSGSLGWEFEGGD